MALSFTFLTWNRHFLLNLVILWKYESISYLASYCFYLSSIRYFWFSLSAYFFYFGLFLTGRIIHLQLL